MIRLVLALVIACLPFSASRAQGPIPCDVDPHCEKKEALPKFEIIIRPARPIIKPAPKAVPVKPRIQVKPRPKKVTVRIEPKAKPSLPKRAKITAQSWDGLKLVPAPMLTADDFKPVAGQYIVDLDPEAIRAAGFDLLTIPIAELASLLGIRPEQIRSVQREFMLSAVLRASPGEVAAMTGNPIVRTVHPDVKIKAMGSPAKSPPLSWGLDRLDLPLLPLDGRFDRAGGDYQARLYLFDSGVDSANSEFGMRVTFGARFANAYPDTSGHCRDHGTEMASMITGANTGVAPRAEVIDVVVLPCSTAIAGEGSSLVEAGEWLLLREKGARDNRPVIVNMSLAGPFSEKVNDAVSVLTRNGVAVVAAAGNNGKDACGFSPASAEDAVTVAATGPKDEVTDFSNFGDCVDIHAPGRHVTAVSSNLKDGAYVAVSGTSGAAALVSGLLARSVKAKGPKAAADWLAETAAPSALWSRTEDGLLLAQASGQWKLTCRATVVLALRGRPGPAAPVSAALERGETATIGKVSGNWVEVTTAKGKKGWTTTVIAGAPMFESLTGGACAGLK